MFYKALILISALSFLFYSVRSLYSKSMINEFERWGFDNFRLLISFFQFLAAIALIVGFYNLKILALSSFLLAIMMICAIIVRIRVNDSFLKTLPAIFYSVLNLTILYLTYIKLY